MVEKQKNIASEENVDERAGKTKRQCIKIKHWIEMGIFLAVLAIVLYIFFKPKAEEPSTEIMSSSTLEEMLRISDLYVYKVTYNGVVPVYENDDKKTLLYRVSYESDVTISINVENIKAECDDEKRIVWITLPELEFEATIKEKSLDYIFEKSKYNDGSVLGEALDKCRSDAKEKCQKNQLANKLAKEQAMNTINALLQPILEQEGYSAKLREEDLE